MNDDYAYIGTKKCGCTVAAVVDEVDYPKDVAESVAEFIQRGYTIRRVLRKDVNLVSCYCGREAKEKE